MILRKELIHNALTMNIDNAKMLLKVLQEGNSHWLLPEDLKVSERSAYAEMLQLKIQGIK